MASHNDYLPAEAFADATWQMATASQPNQSCVEFSKVGHIIGVRDNKLGSGSAILQFTEQEIAAMLAGAKDGEFDHLTLTAPGGHPVPRSTGPSGVDTGHDTATGIGASSPGTTRPPAMPGPSHITHRIGTWR